MKSAMLHNVVHCVGCRLCERTCPHRAITFAQGSFTYRGDRYQRYGACERVCLQDVIALQGKEMTLEAIMAELCRDRDYYESSGSGITFSGGEPSAQQEALWELLRACKQEGFHTTVGATGDYSRDLLIRMIPLINLFLSNFKHPDDATLYTITDTDGTLIKKNLRHLLKVDPQKVIICIPVISRFNCEKDTLESALRYLRSIGVCRVDLPPYHTPGKVKYEKMGKSHTLSNKMLQKENPTCCLKYARQLGMQANISG